MTQRAHEVELAATAPDSHAAATWLKSLESASGVRAVEIVDMRRQTVAAPLAKAGKLKPVDPPVAYDFVAVVRWTEQPANIIKAKAVTAARSAR